LDARGAVPYDGDSFVGVFKVLWPGGAVDEAALEVMEAGDIGPLPVAGYEGLVCQRLAKM
jgi:hypothetical protein